jgi:secondary thiamine-phosphate synthase enzyme
MDTTEISIETGSRTVVDLTDRLLDFCSGRGDGLVNVLAPHATAGVALMETGSGSEADLGEVVDRLLPRDDRWRHQHGSAGHGADHVLPVFVSPTLSLPVQDSRPLLGTWQRLVFVDYNQDNPHRRLRLSFVPA